MRDDQRENAQDDLFTISIPFSKPMATTRSTSFNRPDTYTPRHVSSYRSVATEAIELTEEPGHHYESYPSSNTGRWDDRRHCRQWRLCLPAFVDEVKSTPWKWLIRRFLSHVLPVMTIVGLVVLLAVMSIPSFVQLSDGAVCLPDGNFRLSVEDYTPWNQDAIFAINIGYGEFSFGVAKLIDVIFDVIVGRGGQVLLAFFSYKTFTKALTRTMETSSVSNDMFESLTLRNDTFAGTLALFWAFLSMRNSRAKFAVFWTIPSALFILVIPTWLSAMTGYTADVSGFVRDPDGVLYPAESFLPTIYTIHDGERLGDPYTKDYRVTVPWRVSQGNTKLDLSTESNSYGCSNAMNYNSTTEENDWLLGQDKSCEMLWRVSGYVAQYGFLGRNNTNSTFLFGNGSTNKTLDTPSLNVSAHLVFRIPETSYYQSDDTWYYAAYGFSWQDPLTQAFPYQQSDPLFTSGNTVYNLKQFNEQGTCQQQGAVRYKWGFSFLLLYNFVVTFLVWTCVMFALYIDAFLHSRLDRIPRHMGLKRAVLDLSIAMQKKIGNEETKMLSDSKLDPFMRGQMTYADLSPNLLPPTRWTMLQIWWRDFKIRAWAKQEKWWLVAMVVFTALLVMSFTVSNFEIGWSYYFSTLPGIGVLLVLILGREVRGRWVVFVLCMLLFLAGDTWWTIRAVRFEAIYRSKLAEFNEQNGLF